MAVQINRILDLIDQETKDIGACLKPSPGAPF